MNDNKIIIGRNRNASILLNENADFSPADKAELEKLSKAFLSGASAPTTETETTVLGAVYVTASGNVYHCTNISGNVFTWEKFVKATDYASSGSAGVIITSTVFGTTGDSAGVLKSTVIQYQNYNDNITPDDAFISKGTLNNVIAGAKLKPEIVTSSAVAYTFNMDTADNKDYRLTYSDLASLEFMFFTNVYDNDFSMSISFQSGDVPTDVSYYVDEPSGYSIINWVGADCTRDSATNLSVFTPQANTHYEIIIYFNGVHFVGEVAGYVPAVGNPASA